MEKEERLKDLMLGFDTDELLENAYLMGYNKDGKMDRLEGEKLADGLAKAILKKPEHVLRRLPQEDLQLLQLLTDAEPGIGMKARNTRHVMAMCDLGLARETECDKENDLYMIYITEDFKKAIRPHLDQVLNDFEVKFRLYVEQIILGALNIYGLLTENELKMILKRCLDLTDDGSGVFEHVYQRSVMLLLQEDFTDDGKSFFTSPFVYDYEEILKTRKEHPDLKRPKHFSRDEIQRAGEMPVPSIPNPYEKQLMKMLKKDMGFDQQETYYNIFLAWLWAQDRKVPPVAIVQHIIDQSDKVSGIDMLNQVTGVLMDYMNNTPRWGFYGRCPNDIAKDMEPMTAPPRISLGPNARKMGYTQEQVQGMVDDLWEERMNPASSADPLNVLMPYIAPPKVGRNDPCPCGSGKKYKNCCGRGN